MTHFLGRFIHRVKGAGAVGPIPGDIRFFGALIGPRADIIRFEPRSPRGVYVHARSNAPSHVNLRANDREWKDAIKYFKPHGFVTRWLAVREPSVDREPK